MTNQTSRAKTDAHHKEVAEAIIKMIEGGTAPWQKPWDGNASAMMLMPFNGASKRRYRGINSLYLYTVANFKGYKDPRWFTFKQVEELGGKVKRGEKSVKVEYWQFKRTIKEDENGKPLAKEDWLEVDRKVPLIMRSAVFNAEQCEGIPELELPKRDWEPLERADTIMKASGVPVFHDAVDRNYYSPGSDEIHLTPMEAFPTREAYYGTALHELGHSTGHEKRLNRQFGKTFGDENYAKEELRAEIASFMLCSDLGISRQASDEQHAAYVGSWVKALKSDPNEIFKASADAENICNYLYDREREYMKNLGNEIEPNVPNNSVNYPEIEPSVTKVAEQVAGYALPNISQLTNEADFQGESIDKDRYLKFDEAWVTNYYTSEDNKRLGTFVIDGKAYLGSYVSDAVVDSKFLGTEREGTTDYYDSYYINDGSLVKLSDNPKIAELVSARSFQVFEGGNLNLDGFSVDDLLEARTIESNLLNKYQLLKDVPSGVNENLLIVSKAVSTKILNKDYVPMYAYEVNGSVYLGNQRSYEYGKTYASIDSFIKVSDNPNVLPFLHSRDLEELSKFGNFSESDFNEYAVLKGDKLSEFLSHYQNFDSEVVENSVKEVNSGMERKGYNIDNSYTTNFVEDGKQLGAFVIDGKAYLGLRANMKYQPEKDENGFDVMISYYDNSDGSLVHLSDKPEMAGFIGFRSYDVSQDGMQLQRQMDVLGKIDYVTYVEAKQLEETVLAKYDAWEDLPEKVDNNIVVMDAASISNWERNGKQLDVFIKNDSVYMGERDRYDNARHYDNSDYSLVKISDNRQMFHLLYGSGYVTSQEELIKFGEFTEHDFKEYADLKNGVLKDFDEVKQIMFDDEPFKSPYETEVNAVSTDAVVREAAREIGDNPFAGMTEVVEYVDTNFEKDGRRIAMVNVNGELHMGYSDNCKFDVQMGDAPQTNKIISYYDNSDDSLDYLTDRVHMAQFIRGMSYGYSQDQMLNASGGYNLGAVFSSLDYEEYEYHESRTFSEFNRIDALLDGRSDTDINLNYVGKFDYTARDENMLGGKELEIFEKSGSFYVGDADNYDVFEGTYDNSDYTLFKVTDKLMVMELIADNEIDVKANLESGNITHADLQEYFLFNERTSEIFVPNFSNKVINDRARLLSDDYVTNFPRIDSHIIPANLADRVILTSKEGTFVGKRQNMLFIHGAKYYGEKIYDNRDGSLVKLSDNPKMAELISDRAFGFNMQTIMEVREGEFTVKDFEEYNKIYDEYLSKLEFTSTYEDMGRFDIKEAMKMADEQVNGQVNEAVKEFNPPSDAQLALAESLHCKYKEDVSREELAKIIAKTMEARKKYYEAINQPAKETQLEVLKEAGIEVKDGLTIGQASKMIAELPASTNQKVFMDRLKIEYAPEITRGEVEKLIKGKMKELEARENEPASEKTREFMKSRGIEVPEKLTRAEASKLIYNSAPTAKQMAFITNHKIECDKDKLTYGKASILIDKRLKYIDEQAKLPATEKQIKRLEKEKIEFAPEITRGEANKLINKAVMEKLQVSEKQIKYANDLGLEIPENATKAEVTKLIGEKVKANRIDKIADFEVPKDRKLTLSEGYYKLAQKYLEKGKEIDDKKIAASLLKDGHRDCDVKSVIHKNSPNCVNDLSKAQSIVNEAKKLPSVKKALEKENSR